MELDLDTLLIALYVIKGDWYQQAMYWAERFVLYIAGTEVCPLRVRGTTCRLLGRREYDTGRSGSLERSNVSALCRGQTYLPTT